MVADGNGTPVDFWDGYKSPADFCANVQQALADPTTVDAKAARLAAKPTAADAAHLARIRSSQFKLDESLTLYRQAQELDPGTTRANDILDVTARGYFRGKGSFDAAAMQKAADAVVAGGNLTPSRWIEVAEMMSAVGQRSQDPTVAVPTIKAAVAATADLTDPELIAERKPLLVDHALYVEKDTPKAVQLKRESMPADWMQTPKQLNSFGRWCYDNKVNLEEAETLTRKGVELASAGREKASLLGTTADLCSARGQWQEAVSFAEQAVKEDPQSARYPQQVERLKKEMATRN
jgi:tetratricopeptide (TPR) repeat protein